MNKSLDISTKSAFYPFVHFCTKAKKKSISGEKFFSPFNLSFEIRGEIGVRWLAITEKDDENHFVYE